MKKRNNCINHRITVAHCADVSVYRDPDVHCEVWTTLLLVNAVKYKDEHIQIWGDYYTWTPSLNLKSITKMERLIGNEVKKNKPEQL